MNQILIPLLTFVCIRLPWHRFSKVYYKVLTFGHMDVYGLQRKLLVTIKTWL